ILQQRPDAGLALVERPGARCRRDRRGSRVAPALLVALHPSTLSRSATFASHSSLELPPTGAASRLSLARLLKYVVSANSRSAATRLGRYGCERDSSS